ncbi:MAG: GWxTD domain-containing protein, partial [Candidatus Aminicenantes bacterium]
MRKLNLAMMIGALVLILLLSSCASTGTRSQLDPLNQEFLSKVRYIISKEESKIFSELPPSARDEFIEKFWERRDPTPETETNEYQEAYFERIEEANKLFRGGGRPGWLQDRGRIYILFGPPSERHTNPMGGQPIDPYEDPKEMVGTRRVAVGEKPTEIWIYYNLLSSFQKPHQVRLRFVDTLGTGDYKLSTNIQEALPGAMGVEASAIQSLGFSHELYKEEAERTKLHLERALFNFSWEFLMKKNREIGSNLSILIAIPYKKVVFSSQEGRLIADMSVEIQIKSISDEVIWLYEDKRTLDFREEDLMAYKDAAWEMEIPVRQWLNKGKYFVYIRLHNLSGD